MKTLLIQAAWIIVSLCLAQPGHAQMPDPPGQVGPGEKAKYEAYLFAHMMNGDYGHLCSLSSTPCGIQIRIQASSLRRSSDCTIQDGCSPRGALISNRLQNRMS